MPHGFSFPYYLTNVPQISWVFFFRVLSKKSLIIVNKEKEIMKGNKLKKLMSRRKTRFWSREEKQRMAQLLPPPPPLKSYWRLHTSEI